MNILLLSFASLLYSRFEPTVDVQYIISVRSSHPLILKESQAHSIPLPDLGKDLYYNYAFTSTLNAQTTGQSVLGLRGFFAAESLESILGMISRCRMYVSQPSLLTVKVTVSLDSVPVVALFACPNGTQPVSLLLKDAVIASKLEEDGSSTFLFTPLNSGYYVLAYGLKNTADADIQLGVFSNNPLRFYYNVCCNKEDSEVKGKNDWQVAHCSMILLMKYATVVATHWSSSELQTNK